MTNPTTDLGLGTAVCPKCHTAYRLNADNLGHRSICVKCGQNFHLLPTSEAADTLWVDTTAAQHMLADRVWEKGLDLRVGQVVLGVYVVQEILGRGGLGQVFKVRHQEWQKELALKLPYRNVMEPKYYQALKNEAETWVALGLHPHVVTCHYVRPMMGVPAIFMEYISGGSVKDLTEGISGSTPVIYQGDERQRTARILDLAIQAAWGLEYAHGRGVLHLDIKPQNLLFEEDTGRLLVTDFGLARAAKETKLPSDSASLWPRDVKDSYDPKSGLVQTPPPGHGGFGTPQYMSPEASERLSPAVGFDLWALSLTLFELFLGQRPWEYGGSVGVAFDQYLAAVKPVTEMPDQVREFLKRALAADPDRRYAKASDMALALIGVYKDYSCQDYPRRKPYITPDSADNLNNRAVSLLDLDRPEEAEKLWRQALREDPTHLWAFHNLALHRFHHKALSPEAFNGALDELTKMAAGRIVPELPLALSGAYLDLGYYPEAKAALESFTGPAMSYEARRLREILERRSQNPNVTERSRSAHPRLSMIATKASEDVGKTLMPQLLAKAAAAIEAGDDSGALVALKEARNLGTHERSVELDSLWRSLYGKLNRLDLREILEERSPGLSGEVADYKAGVLVLYDGKSLKFVKNPNSQAPGAVEVRLSSPPVSVDLTNDGSIAAALTEDGHLWLFNPLTGAGAGQALAHTGSGRSARFRPDGRILFTAGDDGELKTWDTSHGYLDKGTPLLVRKLSERPLKAMALSPNCRILSVSDGLLEYRLGADKVTGPVRTMPMSGPGQEVRVLTALVADPFNRYLLSAHQDGLTFHPLFDTDWRLDPGDLGSPPQALAISHDARLLAVALADGRLILGLAPEEGQKSFVPLRRLEAGPARYLSFAPDATHLLAVSKNAVVIYGLYWDLDVAKPRAWDKKAGIVLGNFTAQKGPKAFSEALGQEFLIELNNCGLTGLDPITALSRLKEALDKLA
ncbi:MAG: protein kinase [Deltaproteobacteria bacterium]|nr:protein kinase [Deltaproteobacteria bacterium]